MTLVDSDILIDFSRGNETAAQFLAALEQSGPVAISAVTSMELLVGAFNKQDQRSLEKFLGRFVVIHITESISKRAHQMIQTWSLSHNLQVPDALIAASALDLNASLASKNQRDYRYIPDLNLLPYPGQ